MSEHHRPDPLAVLNDPATVRRRCHAIAAAVESGHSAHFRLDRGALPAIAQRIAALTRRRFPDLQIPYHSRWRHFEAGGVDRKDEIDALLRPLGSAGLARARIDLALISVLLDAGAGPDWHYDEAETGQRLARSEGLVVSTLRAFAAGAFSSRPDEPCRVDARALGRMEAAPLAAVFQVRPDNPLVGLEGRAALLRRLGAVMAAQPERFGDDGRPGGLFDRLAARARQRSSTAPALQAAELLVELLASLAPIWPSGQSLDGRPIGDVWPHPQASAPDAPAAGRVPFHKLSQWLTYSLLEPFEWAGIAVDGLDALTGLPEYRNGGLLLDGGVLRLRDAGAAQARWTPADPLVVEWRALTVALLDELGPLTCRALGLPDQALPLACILEGGTWAAGRVLAQRLRGGLPPLQIESDGTVF